MAEERATNIKELIERIGEVDRALTEWSRALDAEAERVAREQGIGSQDRAKYLIELTGEGAARIREKVGVGPRDAAYAFLDELCAAYLKAKPDEREEVRRAMAGSGRLRRQIFDYASRNATLIRSPEDVEWLRLGLAAASIDDLRTDFRDTLLALGELYLAAMRAGIEPLAEFSMVSKTSNPERSREDNHMSMRDLLAGFQSTAFFEASVKPRRTSTPSV